MPAKRTSESKQASLSLAQRLLEQGFRISTVSQTLQRKHGLSRATAYRDCEEAQAMNDAEDMKNGQRPDDAPGLDERDAILRLAHQLMIDAAAAGDISGFSRLAREYERLHAMGGRRVTL